MEQGFLKGLKMWEKNCTWTNASHFQLFDDLHTTTRSYFSNSSSGVLVLDNTEIPD
jgi:hypothetical protein